MSKRVYVMDCGEFVKIGISSNPEIRKRQIPYSVYQYYATKPIPTKLAYEIERKAHNKYSYYNIRSANGREYFNVSFKNACEFIQEQTNSNDNEKMRMQTNENRISDIYISLPETSKKLVMDYVNKLQKKRIQRKITKCF